jgi:hypothetical protein
MSSFLHVNGYASCFVGTQDAAQVNGLVELGWTVDGVDLSFIAAHEDVFTDRLGGHIPEDVQNFGEEARITLNLIKYDLAVLRRILTREYNTGTLGITPNEPSLAGDLMVQCGKMFSLYVKRQYGGTSGDCKNPGDYGMSSGSPEGGWLFPRCFVVDERSVKVGTKVTRHNIVIRALPNASGRLYIENAT